MWIKKGKLLISTGMLLVAAALMLTVYNFYDGYKAKQASGEVLDKLEEILSAGVETGNRPALGIPEAAAPIKIPDYILNPGMDVPVQNIDGQDYIGILEIPAYDLVLPVISDWSYSKLKIAPCRYVGSAYTDDLIIAAHNYKAHFGNLQNLREEDTVIFTDMDGNVFNYQVVEREILAPSDVEEMNAGEWDLTLFTCTIGGANRVTVRCERVEY